MSSDESDNDFVANDVEEDEGSVGSAASDDAGSDVEDVKPKVKKDRKRKIASDSEGDEEAASDKDDEEEEDSEDDSPKKTTKKKKGKRGKNKRPRGLDFILQDVDVDDEELEEDEYDEDDARALEPNEKEEAERYLKQIEQDRRRSDRDKFANMSAEEIGRYFENKYKKSQNDRAVVDDDDSAVDEITRSGILPSTKEPNLWIVKCRMGEEKMVALLLMRKYLAHENTQEPLQIKSVVVKEGLKGMIYVESYKQAHVASAIEGISALNQFNITMVPIKDMVDVLRVVKDTPQLKIGSYVRLNRTMFKGDLAQVDLVDIGGNKVNLKLIPRIDYNRMRGAMRTEADRNYKLKRRPMAKLFDVDAIKDIGGEVTNDGDFVTFEGNSYRRGFLYKYFPLNAILADGVKPSLAELEKFQEANDDLKKELESTSIKETENPFVPGDMVEVKSGELVNLRGKVETIDGSKVVLIPDQEGLKDPITLNAYELRKYFKDGDHVKVISGRYEGHTGLIVRVVENNVIMLSDLGMDELKVRSRDLQLCADVTTGVDSLGQFQYHDLVQLDQAGTVGVIVRLERENLEVLNMHGKIIRIKPQAIISKKDVRFSRALDSQNNSIEARDLVKIVDGPHAKEREREDDTVGEVKHVYRNFAFVYLRKMTQNGGMISCRCKHLLLQGAKKQETPVMARMQSPNPMASPRPFGAATPRSDNMSTGSRSVGGQTPKNNPNLGTANNLRIRRNNAIIGKNIRVTQGPFKGYFGIVRDATEQTARVELHSSCKTISVDCSRLMVVGDAGRATTSGAASFLYSKTPSSDPTKTPMYSGSKTPMYGSATPMYGSQTPAQDGSRTPHYGSMTPAYENSHGGRTPAYDRTPAFTPGYESSSGRTPAYDSGSNRTPAYGNRTPAYETAGDRTPAYDNHSSGRTPAYDSMSAGGRTPAYENSHGGRTPAYENQSGRTPAYENQSGRTPAYENQSGRTPAYESAKTPAYDNEFAPQSPTYDGPSSPRDSDEEEEPERVSSPVYDSPASPQYVAPTPGANLNPQTPYSVDSGNFNAPMTPGNAMYNDYAAPSPFPSGPNYEAGSYSTADETIPQHHLSQGKWIVQNMYVTIVDHDPRFNDREGVVRQVANGRVELYVPDLKTDLEADFDQVVPTRPHAHDYVRVIYGPDMGYTGVVVELRGSSAIIRSNADHSLERNINAGLCCRMAGD
ncbi:unnamed protein product [Caenorhabditis auriculariae]|uniref:Transcription elongation factor SPT5 n=1 Tax=Caenorhabditis auriculariae TaxID=2777116 RepID=A0A8S1HIS0_9PELO|nr:unnamed protein product [Caenorhabditis auriculariae]